MFAYLSLLVPLLWPFGFALRRRPTRRLRRGGLLKPYASIDLRVPGTRTQGTGTTAGCSSRSPRGVRLGVSPGRIWLARGNRYIELGSCGIVTINLGANGGRRDYVD